MMNVNYRHILAGLCIAFFLKKDLKEPVLGKKNLFDVEMEFKKKYGVLMK